jgi:hypothetical protein
VHPSRSKRRADFIALLELIDTQYGLTRDRAKTPIVLVLDNDPIHTSKATRRTRRAGALAHGRMAAE